MVFSLYYYFILLTPKRLDPNALLSLSLSLQTKAKSVSGVAFSGPKLETAVVTLIDGTQFGISGERDDSFSFFPLYIWWYQIHVNVFFLFFLYLSCWKSILFNTYQFPPVDIYESSTDPRSPLKVIATCRSYKVPTKSVGLEEAVLSLSSEGSKKKRVYMNERVRVAAEKEKEKKLRMEQDELDRQAELEQMGR